MEEAPELSREIVAEAIQLNPALAAQISAAIAPAAGPAIGIWPIVGGIGGVGAAGAAAAGGGGGGGSGGGATVPGPLTPQVPVFNGSDEYANQEGLALVRAQDAYDRGLTGKNVVVGVLDTGLDVSHPEFAGQIAPGGFDFIGGTVSMSDPHGHGTHVSGIIGARKDDNAIHGVAYDAKILPIRILNASGNGTLSDAQMSTLR